VETTIYEACSQVLGRETELLCGIEAAQKQVWDAVINREWTDFEALLSMMDRIGVELGGLEEERERIIHELAEPLVPPAPGSFAEPLAPGSFYRLISGLPEAERKELTGLYRELKMAGIRVRIANENLLSYIAEVKATMTGFIEAAFPDRKGKVYARNGAVVPADMRSMVLNRSF
jgi:hypothetical protein